MNSRLGIHYALDIEVLTPLHIGSGRKLMEGFDFARQAGYVYRLNVDSILEDRWPDDEQQQQLLLSKPAAALLEPKDYVLDSSYFHYRLSGEPALHEIIECVHDVRGRAYLPGSSLKGAIRTVVLRAALEREKVTIKRSDIGAAGGPNEAKQADDKIEHAWLGRDPNYDLMRTVKISDSAPVPSAALRLQRVRVVPGLDVDVEVMARGTHLTAGLQLDTWLLKQQTAGLDWPERMRELMRRLPEALIFIARKQILHEYEYHRKRNDTAAASYYGKLGEEVGSDQWPKNEFLVQVGFATGWRSKSVLGNLPDDSELLEKIVHDFRLDRGGGKGRGYKRGDPFPKARHLAYIGDKPALPMGWLRVQMITE